MPQRSSIVDIVQLLVTGVKGSTTCQRAPALTVSVGVMRQESCTNRPNSFMRDFWLSVPL
jgi:hypothetical protein